MAETVHEEPEQGFTSEVLDMSEVKIRDLAVFTHPRLQRAQKAVVKLLATRKVVAGFGSAI